MCRLFNPISCSKLRLLTVEHVDNVQTYSKIDCTLKIFLVAHTSLPTSFDWISMNFKPGGCQKKMRDTIYDGVIQHAPGNGRCKHTTIIYEMRDFKYEKKNKS